MFISNVFWFIFLTRLVFHLQFSLNASAYSDEKTSPVIHASPPVMQAKETNVFPPYLWKTTSIEYTFDKRLGAFDNKNVTEKLTQMRSILVNVLNEFQKVVGPILTWTEISYSDTVNRIERYMVFGLDSYGCGYSESAQDNVGIPTVIALSNESGCDLYTNMAHFLTAFGMIAPNDRKDRDNYIVIHYDNIQPMDHSSHRTCIDCMISDKEIFKEYDYLSILHAPKYSRYAINPKLPVITERNQSISLLPESYNYTGRRFSPTDIKIFQFLFSSIQPDSTEVNAASAFPPSVYPPIFILLSIKMLLSYFVI